LRRCFGAAVFGLIGTSWFPQPDALQQAVAGANRAVTGLDLVVQGAIDVSVFPGSYVSFHNVGLGAAASPTRVAGRRPDRNLRLLPLLLRRSRSPTS